MNFMEKIIAKASADKKTIVLPEGTDRRVVTAAAEVVRRGIADVILLGNEKEIKEAADGLDLSGVRIIDPKNTELHKD